MSREAAFDDDGFPAGRAEAVLHRIRKPGENCLAPKIATGAPTVCQDGGRSGSGLRSVRGLCIIVFFVGIHPEISSTTCARKVLDWPAGSVLIFVSCLSARLREARSPEGPLAIAGSAGPIGCASTAPQKGAFACGEMLVNGKGALASVPCARSRSSAVASC